ncbi:hypothetical protein UA08_07564 [Talaromyces atroroseus]|uniref:Zn(2)-C6 fungal-type domain-containing protein n=1 Tax=Talaromyces atroroseus TaxID=1441469 RepID=A0A225AQU1_TALAT|nr:hypothetical protein UA08_07564 [Talaromyces atroroseus]OKL57286.1 hypothetical protein UA08_07564 [Talaromyces atroroseus]
MMAPSHITPLEASHHRHLHHPEVIQQPRRFACDRCRMQKLRCERDIWRPSLMPCKRCRKARMNCTISSMDRPISKKKSKDRVGPITKLDKTAAAGKRYPQGDNGKSPGLDVSEQSPLDTTAAGFYGDAVTEGFNMMGVPKFVSEIVPPEECYPASSGFEEYPAPIFSGLVTPPSMESEREHQLSLETTSFMVPQHQNWTPISVMTQERFHRGLTITITAAFPCLDDRKQWWDQENLRRLLDVNMHLLDCQGLVSQELAMLGNMDANVALNNLESASQNVMRYSQQFLDVVKVFIHRDFASIPVSMAFVSQMPTPNQSRRPSHVQVTTSTVEPALVQGGDASLPPQIGPVTAAHVSSSPTQSPWQGSQFEDVQVSLILATINCYTCLVGSYHIILSYLLHELMAITTPEQHPQSSPTFTGFAAAFAATSHIPSADRNSQLRLIFNNCIRMLSQLEMSLGVPEQHCVASWALPYSTQLLHQQHPHDGILSGPVAANLLNALVNQRFGLCVNGLATGKNSVKEIISAINQFFDPVQPVSQVTTI